MIISDAQRLWLYVAMVVVPVWIDWFKLSTDMSLRGLAMPTLTSINAAVVVMLAKTSTKKDEPEEPTQVVAPPGKPLQTVATKPAKRKP